MKVEIIKCDQCGKESEVKNQIFGVCTDGVVVYFPNELDGGISTKKFDFCNKACLLGFLSVGTTKT